ncbi:hypothetical protein JAAARDRAFT_31679 [Jaapia argillacea MUCL 33604]|uniref:NADP-dependent oxidoreductase domain-containing protein n=1 Tax=Jaapia argillacea MUCL 33604 TaxID=933084 RepID=A0A067Q151_9AGAM|nr:hypothetical protein JAAARDRAFT_31679 [Jaapia argillacea MUCL 33604]
MFINSGEFYGPNLSTANLELLSRFFEKYPDYAERTFLSVKGGLRPGTMNIDSSLENLRGSVDRINAALRGKKRLDLYESARVDPNTPVEEAVKNMAQLVKEGKFDHIGMSECSAQTLRRANAVHPIAAVEIEVSPWSYEDETRKVIATAKELDVTVVAYSPLGRGFLTGQITKPSDLPDGDMRKHMTRFHPDNFDHNLQLVDAMKKLAAKKGITPAQLCIGWVGGLGSHILPLPGSSNKKRTLENLAGGDVELTTVENAELANILETFTVKGGRYTDSVPAHVLKLWG